MAFPPGPPYYCSPSCTAGDGGLAAALAPAPSLLDRAESFLEALLRSSLIQSALLSLEVSGSHPVHEHGCVHGIEWTIAQMLALHLKAGYASGGAPHR
jgi:hypothetical protein